MAMNFTEENPTKRRRRPRVLFLNRSYWPDGEATGQLLTELAEDLASRFEVSVIAGLPNANPTRQRFRLWRAEMRDGVRILRVPHSRFPKRWLPGRAINFVTFLFGAIIRGVLCRRQEIVVVETDPFLLAFVGWLLRIRHRARLIVYLQDIHPDLGIAIGRLRETLLTRLLQRALVFCYRRADRVVVLSEDMRRTILAMEVDGSAVVRLPNWIDTRLVKPCEQSNGFRARAEIDPDAFVVMYSGNLGVTQQLDRLLNAAESLREHNEILFVLVGSGAAEAALRKQVVDRMLTNVKFFPFQPKSALGESLSAADLHLVTVHPSALAYLMPSKLYGILAAGRAVLAAVPEESEFARIIRENRIGFVVPPGDAEAMAQTIADASNQRDELLAAGARARRLAVDEYDRTIVTRKFGDMLDEVLAESPRSFSLSPAGNAAKLQ